MASKDRIAMFPSRANYVTMKQRMVSATNGLGLLKRKRDALELKLRELNAELKKTSEIVEKVMQEAIFSMAKANYLNTDFKPAAVLRPKNADVYLTIKNTNMLGLTVPTFQLVKNASSSLPLTGLSRGGAQVEVIRKKYQDAIEVLVSMASLKYAVIGLQAGVRQNNMRVNGLDYVMIPRFRNTIDAIAEALDELEREDFYRLKQSIAKQRQLKQRFAELIIQKNRERELENQQRFVKTDINMAGVMVETFDIDEFEKSVKLQEKTADTDRSQQGSTIPDWQDAIPDQEETNRPEAEDQIPNQEETERADRQAANEEE